MRTSKFKWMRLGLVALFVLLAAGPLANTQSASAQSNPAVGIVCTNGPTFNLSTGTGYIVLSDANTMFMWSYSVTGGAFQYPGPVLCVNQGDTVTVILQNNLSEATSIIFPGQENVLANGVPAQPEFSGGGDLISLTKTAPAGGTVTYSFVANKPGTFIYESGTDSKKQVAMGLASVLVVRPSAGANFANNRPDSRFTPEEEFLALLSDIDPYLHQAVEDGVPFNMNNYHPRYWLLNGRGFPDTIADNYAPWLPNQPYGALARIHPYDATLHPYPGIERFVNIGTEDYPFHPHGQNGLVIGRDGNAVEGTGGEDLSFEKFAVNIGPGQTWDVLFKWYDAENYSESNPIPVTIPDIANQSLGMFYSGSPYLGVMGPMPPGVSTLNQCGEYYIISHNHALFQLDAWGQVMAGPITYVRIDPPLPNNCP
ncbi:MAG: multicopper oxidase domain-containing protein [Chloroflexi bacterium]|nr:multicopper oxidase domain-containing protein [Chloroflexota bacterium]